MSAEARDAADELTALYAEVDREVAGLEERHAGRLRCGRGCSGCCVDDLTVFELEAERIQAHHGALLARARPGPTGACAFLDEQGACRVYEDRPYVCRTQGLPLRWVEGEEEFRSICTLNEDGPPLVQLPSVDCFELGPFEARLAGLEARRKNLRPGTPLRRVALRSLFKDRGQD